MTKNEGSPEPLLILESVSKSFYGLLAVDELNLVVPRGARQALIGPNGAGKTTIFNLISGMLRPTAGRIIYSGKDITCVPPHRRAALGITRTFQITTLFLNLSVLENLILACQGIQRTKFVMSRPVTSYRRFTEKSLNVLKDFDLLEKQNELVKNLSYGEQRQIEVAVALIGSPSLLLLDEPTAGLSPAEAHGMTRILKKLPLSLTILLIEHDMDVAFEVAETITVLFQGRVLAEGAKEEIRKNPKVQQIYLGGEVQPC